MQVTISHDPRWWGHATHPAQCPRVVHPCQPEVLALQIGPMCGASESERSRAKMPVSKDTRQRPFPSISCFELVPNQQSSFPLWFDHNALNYIDLHKMKHDEPLHCIFFGKQLPLIASPRKASCLRICHVFQYSLSKLCLASGSQCCVNVKHELTPSLASKNPTSVNICKIWALFK